MSEQEKDLVGTDREIDPYRQEAIVVFDVNEEYHTVKIARNLGYVSYAFAALALLSAPFQFEPGLGLGLAGGLFFWTMHRLSLRQVNENERYVLTATHFLLLRKSINRAHPVTALQQLLVDGSERDTDNSYCLVFPEDLTYRMSCGERSKEFVNLISKATNTPLKEGPFPSVLKGLKMRQKERRSKNP